MPWSWRAGSLAPRGRLIRWGSTSRVGAGGQEFTCSDGTGVTKLDLLLAPLPTYLGALGSTGLTAYFGLLDEQLDHDSGRLLG